MVSKRTLRLLTAATIVFGLAGPFQARAADTIRVGMLKPNLVSVLHWIAMETGAYEANDLAVEEHPFPSGQSVAGIHELMRGNLDFYIGAGAEVPRANSQAMANGDTPPLAVIEGLTPGVSSIVLRKDLEGKTFEELKGESLRIGISSPSSIHLALFRGFLQEKGMTTDDLKWQFIRTSGGDMAPALLAGQLDGFMHSEPTTTLALTSGSGFVFMNAGRGDMGKKSKIVPVTFVSGNRAFMESHPEVARRFVKALYDASKAYEKLSKDEIVAIMSEWAKQEPKILGLAYERIDPRTSLNREAADAWWEFIGEAMKSRGEVGENVKFNDIFDLSYQDREAGG